MRTIQHPDVETNEIDISQIAPAIAGTKCLITGFSDRGESLTPFEFTSRNAFLNYFGKPTNEAEYYFYYAVNEVIQQNGGVVAARIPYNNNASDNFNTVTFDASTILATTDASISGTVLSALSNEYNVSGIQQISTSSAVFSGTSTVDGLRTGLTQPASDTIVVVNKLRDTAISISTDEEYSGLFVSIVTPFNALGYQKLTDWTTTSAPYDGWEPTSAILDTTGSAIASGVFGTPLTDDIRNASVNKSLVALYPAINVDDDGYIDHDHLRQVMVVVGKTVEDSSQPGKLNVQILESFVGSTLSSAIDPSTGESIFIDEIVNNNSDYIELYSNIDTSPTRTIYGTSASDNEASLLSFAQSDSSKTITPSAIFNGLDTIFSKTSNIDETQIDIMVDAGMSNIANFCPASGGSYTPYIYRASHEITQRSDVDNWRTTCNKMIQFCQSTRKDCIATVDGPRALVLQGNEKIERPSAPSQLIDTDVLPKFRYIAGLNSNYGTGNMMWDRVVNEFTGLATWVPPSCKTAGVMVYTDRVANYWDAPAGLNRGILYGVSDIAFNPNDDQMDYIYTRAWNYARNYPLDGIVLEGQKTLQVKPSAFDRVNVRRLFLRLERATYQVLRYFMYEPNNYFTRTQIVDVLTPLFEDVKVRGGLYDYRVICNEKNNTAEVIDRNELKISILLKATKTAEFILANFYALRTGASFDEVIL